MVLVHDTLSHCALECMKFQPNSFNSIQLTEQTKIALILAMLHGEKFEK